MFNRSKKGFTIVELIIVIAVIAVLAAVLIPTFSNLIQQANKSADIQAVCEMNTQLSIAGVSKNITNISDVVTYLGEQNINLQHYKPLTSDTYFYWVKSLNKIVYTDEDNKVLYPDENKNLTKTMGDWFSLSGEIKQEDYTLTKENNTNKVSISNGGEFSKLVSDFNKQSDLYNKGMEITLTDDVDLAGAVTKIDGKRQGSVGNADDGIQGNVVIDGGGHTIYGFRCDSNSGYGSGEFSTKGYGYGLFYNISKNANVVLKNINFSGMNVADTIDETGTMGLIVGYLYGTLTLENVTIENSYVCGYQKVGGIAGRVDGTLNLKNVTMKNVDVSGGVEVAKVAGFISQSTGAKFVAENVVANENVMVKLADKYSDYSSWAVDISTDKLNTALNLNMNGKFVVYGSSVYGINTDAYYWFLPTNPQIVTIDGKTIKCSHIATSDNIQ